MAPPADADDNGAQGVRFASHNQEIEPAHSNTFTDASHDSTDLPSNQQAELRESLKSIPGASNIPPSNILQKRMTNFNFEPVSLPASRVPSTDSSRRPSVVNLSAKSSGLTTSTPATPPLTPSASKSKEQGKGLPPLEGAPNQLTPQISDSARQGHDAHGAIEQNQQKPSRHGSTPSISIDHIDQDAPVSREPSGHDSKPGSGTTTPTSHYTRPQTPAGNKDDPYSRGRRAPQSKNVDHVDARFKFGKGGSRRSSFSDESSIALPQSTSTSTEAKAPEKSHSGFFGGLGFGHHHHHHHGADDKSDTSTSRHSSALDLKKLLRFGQPKAASHTSSHRSAVKERSSGYKTPPPQTPQTSQPVPFADDHGLQGKYGKFGKILGSGAGGSVRLMKRSSDGVTFAVKQFRDRHANETEREYAKKVTAEFCIGSTLHHGNIIETLDIVQEKGRWYEVMEYAPFDLFAIVMTGKMSREEIACSFLQIVAGVSYLHSMGLAHRDLKLDNVVVTDHGIMKIIDFGSATVFRYPFETGVVLAKGIVGSDPYLAPEVYDQKAYDPQPLDIWSLAIIFACMSLRRFPWKVPRTTDNSFKMFVSAPTEGNPVSPHTSEHPSDPSKPSEPVKGPWRLLRLLPRESRAVIARMLELDPAKRATLEEMYNDPWVRDSPVCHQLEGGKVVNEPGHIHTLEAGQEPAK